MPLLDADEVVAESGRELAGAIVVERDARLGHQRLAFEEHAAVLADRIEAAAEVDHARP